MKHRQVSAALHSAAILMWTFNAVHAQDWDRTQTVAGVAYVSGGIGSDSRDRLAAREKEFNFKLVSTIASTGTYVSDVALAISDPAGKIIARHTTQGPLFMARLPEGAYTLSATFHEQTQSRKFQVRPLNTGRLQTEYLRWPARASEDWTLPWGAP
jgi:hypothetical protein